MRLVPMLLLAAACPAADPVVAVTTVLLPTGTTAVPPLPIIRPAVLRGRVAAIAAGRLSLAPGAAPVAGVLPGTVPYIADLEGPAGRTRRAVDPVASRAAGSLVVAAGGPGGLGAAWPAGDAWIGAAVAVHPAWTLPVLFGEGSGGALAPASAPALADRVVLPGAGPAETWAFLSGPPAAWIRSDGAPASGSAGVLWPGDGPGVERRNGPSVHRAWTGVIDPGAGAPPDLSAGLSLVGGGSVLAGPSAVRIRLSVAGAVGGFSAQAFLAERRAGVARTARPLGIRSTLPAEWTTDPLAPGAYELRVTVRDGAGRTVRPPAAAVTVVAPGGGTLFGPGTPPPDETGPVDGERLEQGTTFRVVRPGYATAVRFWKAAGETGAHTGRLWRVTAFRDSGEPRTGVPLAAVPFTGESASGWQRAELPAPVALSPGEAYVVSVNANARTAVRYGALHAGWASGELVAADVRNGVFATVRGAFPDRGEGGAPNWYRDIAFVPTPEAPAAPRISAGAGTRRPTLAGDAPPGSTVRLRGPGGILATVAADPLDGAWRWQASRLESGTHAVTAEVVVAPVAGPPSPALAVVVPADPANLPPSVDAGPDQVVAAPGSATLAARVEDDGEPVGTTPSIRWTQVSGPAAAATAAVGPGAVRVDLPVAGEYRFRVRADDGAAAAVDEVVVTARIPAPPPGSGGGGGGGGGCGAGGGLAALLGLLPLLARAGRRTRSSG